MKNVKGIILVVLILLGYKCTSPSKTDFIKVHYCIINNNYDDMSLNFKERRDTVFLFYCNVVDNGNYLNCSYDYNTDYAGYFKLSDIKNFAVQLKIKSYRNEEINYLVNLKFQDNGNVILWNINSEPVGYLPQKATFKNCNSETGKLYDEK